MINTVHARVRHAGALQARFEFFSAQPRRHGGDNRLQLIAVRYPIRVRSEPRFVDEISSFQDDFAEPQPFG